jgi:hypothetical protein
VIYKCFAGVKTRTKVTLPAVFSKIAGGAVCWCFMSVETGLKTGTGAGGLISFLLPVISREREENKSEKPIF